MGNKKEAKGKIKNILLAGGRTGGPLMPLLVMNSGLKKFLPKNITLNPIIIEIKRGFGAKIAAKNNYKIEYLPQVKAGFLTFSNVNGGGIAIFKKIFFAVLESFKFIRSFIKAGLLILKYKPVAILSAGGFLAVPLIWANKILRILTLSQTRVVIHQQDPTPGLANKLTASGADILSCVFEETKKNLKFTKADLMLNLVNPTEFNLYKNGTNPTLEEKHKYTLSLLNTEKGEVDEAKLDEIENYLPQLHFKKPLLLVFGGGSGSSFINGWVFRNIKQLTESFQVLHLTGFLQEEEYNQTTSEPEGGVDYIKLEGLLNSMKIAMQLADVVICRASLSSATELMYMQKPSFLVPIPNSHQEDNAKALEPYFNILTQADHESWLEYIQNYLSLSKSKKLIPRESWQTQHQRYFKKLVHNFFAKE